MKILLGTLTFGAGTGKIKVPNEPSGGEIMETFSAHACGMNGREAPADDLAGWLERCGRFLAYCLGRRRGQTKILRILCEQGQVSQRDLQEMLGIQPGSMSEIAAKLEAKGLVAKDRADADRRKILLSPTQQGREWLARQDEEHVRKRRAELFSALSEEEQRTLQALLEKLSVDWEKRFARERRES